ncbi:MAG: adenine phosphoribosyltransferase [Candidatus Brocadiae bacterium]|nr:adenine phosphoribosyltransferase [Candidatus Brocadiia bacterium]
MPPHVTDTDLLRASIRSVPDFPKAGIVFRDITTLLQDPRAWKHAVDALHDRFRLSPPDLVAGIESRGFIFGAPLAYLLGVGFIPIRKPGKLPYRRKSLTYELEYGKDTLEIHEDAVRPGASVLLVDDLLATGGTAAAAAQLVESIGGRVSALAFVVELAFLQPRARLAGRPVESLVVYDKE